jgi:hypothetical protein
MIGELKEEEEEECRVVLSSAIEKEDEDRLLC